MISVAYVCATADVSQRAFLTTIMANFLGISNDTIYLSGFFSVKVICSWIVMDLCTG